MTLSVLQNYIGGRWTPSESSLLLDVTDPAKNAVIARAAVSSPAEVDHAVIAAEAAFVEWRNCGEVGVNACLAAPMAFFPFGGRKESSLGFFTVRGRTPSTSSLTR